jgi:DNA-binding LacI/PurR family transcriptional regulator
MQTLASRGVHVYCVRTMPRRGVTLHDVAREAGVHVSTASRVLNRDPSVTLRAETCARVERAARKLRYRPNALARGLKLAQTGALGMLVPSLRNPVYSAIVRGAMAQAWERQFVLVLAEDAGASSVAVPYDRLVAEGRIDGLLVASARPGSAVVERIRAEELVPCVFVNRRGPDGAQNVIMREDEAARIAAEHLLELGHTRLGHVAGPANIDTARRRADAFAQAVRAAGREPAIEHAAFEESGGEAAIGRLLSGQLPPTGVFVSNINQAIGAVAGVRNAGLSIPHDVSLVSYDDDPVAGYLDPPLTTVWMPLAELGATAVDALLARIAGEAPDDVTVSTSPRLMVRGSTAPPAR